MNDNIDGGPTDAALPEIDAMWNFSDPAETEQRFREVLPLAKGANDKDYLVQLFTQIARTVGLQRRFDEAHAILDEVAEMLEAGMIVPKLRCLLERGRVFNSANEKEKARPFFIEAWERARGAGEDCYAVDAAHMLGICELAEKALGWNERAMEVAQASSQPQARRWLGSLYNNIGWTYHDLGRYEDALNMFERALAYREKQQQPKEIRIARWCVARVTRSLGRVEDALETQRQLEKDADEAGESKGYTCEEIGECLLLLGREEEARLYFANAYRELSKDSWLVANEQPRLQRLAKVGGVELGPSI